MEEPAKTHKRAVLRTFVLLAVSLLVLSLGIAGLTGYEWILKSNVDTGDNPEIFLYIPTGSGIEKVKSILYDQKIIRNHRSFEWVVAWKNYDTRVKPGRYLIRRGMNNRDLVNLLRSGKQEPVRLIFNSITTKEELAGRISRQIEADSANLLRMLNDPQVLRKYNLEPATAFALFIPNTYEFYWNTSAGQFLDRMYREQKAFWNQARISRCRFLGLSIPEVVTLASIVEKETAKDQEKPSIAGVYLNRLKKNWPLQADPTLIFALQDYSIRRVLDKHKEVDSPYNTYIHTGLPPGPICLPSISSIDAVLNPAGDGFMYFCARDDLSGYHVFSVTLAEHSRNAKKYQDALRRLEHQKKYGDQ